MIIKLKYKYNNTNLTETIVADTVGNVCSTYDTLKIKVHFTHTRVVMFDICHP